ncbi:MAG: hypothetical protein JO000_05475 [Alphaproteobacteria bacterium]|nr:hypothetical protein [Alphaproteobacteria bacterium]
MNTSTSLQALAALAIGSALLASATPADAARGGFRPAPARVAPVRSPQVHAVSFNRTSAPAVHRGNARSLLGDLGKVGGAIVNEGKTVGGDILSGKINKIPGDVLKTGGNVAGAVIKTGVNIFTLPPPKLPTPVASNAGKPVKVTGRPTTPTPVVSNAGKPVKITGQPTNPAPVFVPPSTSTGPVFVPPTGATQTTTGNGNGNAGQFIQHRIDAARQAATTRPQIGGRPVLVSVPVMSPGPAYVAPVVQPVAPVVMAPSAPAPVQPSCLRQAVTQDGQVVTFDICTNQAVVGPLAQTQTQVQTQ